MLIGNSPERKNHSIRKAVCRLWLRREVCKIQFCTKKAGRSTYWFRSKSRKSNMMLMVKQWRAHGLVIAPLAPPVLMKLMNGYAAHGCADVLLP
jgi:hypothetical protein